MVKIFFIVSSCFSMVSCKPSEIKDSKEYFSYLANPENGLVKKRTVAGLKISVKYLPDDYLCYNIVKDMGVLNNRFKDSVYKSYEHSLTFLLNIGPDENEQFDVTRVGISDYQEFAKRIEEMSFNAQEWISIDVKGKKYSPEIVKMENINALEKSRNFMVVFNSTKNAESDFRKNDMCFCYDDELFNTGLSKFIFNANDIQGVPKFKF